MSEEKHPSGHTGGPVAWAVRDANGELGEIIRYTREGIEKYIASWSCIGSFEPVALYAAPPAAQQDGGSGGGEAVAREIARMREAATDWRRPALAQVEGPDDLKIYGGTIADDIDRWADMLSSLRPAAEGERDMIARIIDPAPFSNIGNTTLREEFGRGPADRKAAYAKADRILSALQSGHPASGADDVGAVKEAAELLQEMVVGNSSRLTIEHERRARDLLARLTPQDGAVAGEDVQ